MDKGNSREIRSLAQGSSLATSCEELTHWKRLWCWEGLGAGGEEDDRGWDGWMASLTRWTRVWVNSGSWSWTGRPGVLRFMGVAKSRTRLSDWSDLIKGPPPRTGAEPGATQAPRPPHPPTPPASCQAAVPGPSACCAPPPCPLHSPVCLSVCLGASRCLCSAGLEPPSLLSEAAAAARAGSHGALWPRADCTLSVVTHSFLRDRAPLPCLAGSLSVFPPVTSSSGPAGIACWYPVFSPSSLPFWSSSFSLAPSWPRPASSTPAFFLSGLCSKSAAPGGFPDSVLSSPSSTAPARPADRQRGAPSPGPAPWTGICAVFLFCFVFPVSC